MLAKSNLKIGLFGFGVVGHGLYDVLSKSNGITAEVVKICVKNRTKPRSLPTEFFTFDKNDLLQNPEINLIVELIDDADEAYNIVKQAMQNGKSVVTANKKMVATHLAELIELQQQHNVALLYEASACGSIPIIRTLEEYYDNELLYSVSGIFNGSSNYILSKIWNEGLSYNTALKQAQDLGFAETDPTLDVGGFDAKFKLIILAVHAIGCIVKPTDVVNIGIQTLTDADITYAKEKGYKIKLVPTVKKLTDQSYTLYVLPQFVTPNQHLYNVENEYNGVTVQAAFSDKQFFQGKGAGGHPTGSAVLSDVSAHVYSYRYAYKKLHQASTLAYTTNVELTVYYRYNTPTNLAQLGFTTITAQFNSPTHNYVIGTINLQNLLTHRDYIVQNNLMVIVAAE